MCLSWTACAPAPRAAAARHAVEIAPPPEPHTEEEPVQLVSAPRSVTGFADSPLTPFANEVTALALAALDGRPLPSTDIPLERYDSARKLVSLEPGASAPRSAELLVLAFAMEIEANLATNPDAPTARLETLAFLSPAGLKVAVLDQRSPAGLGPLPPYVSGAGEFMTQVVSAARSANWSTLLVGEAERRVLADERLWHEIEKERPQQAELDLISRLAQSSSKPTQFGLDDIGIVTRHRDGTIWALKLNFDHQDGQVVLDTHPLVRVRRLVEEDDEAPPTPVP